MWSADPRANARTLPVPQDRSRLHTPPRHPDRVSNAQRVPTNVLRRVGKKKIMSRHSVFSNTIFGYLYRTKFGMAEIYFVDSILHIFWIALF